MSKTASNDSAHKLDLSLGSISVDRDGGASIITVSSPGRLNAWTRGMRADLLAALRDAAQDSAVRAVVITGAGEAFCSGQDLNEIATWTASTPWIGEIEELYRFILEFPKPTIAAVNGVAAGSGMQLALLCDYRVAAKRAKLGQTEVKWGLASITGTWLLAQVVGPQRARALALTGQLLEASQALTEGLVDEVVADDKVLAAALGLAGQMASYEPEAFRISKRWMSDRFMPQFWEVFREARAAHREAFERGSAHRGVAGFLGRHA
ncbi:enoyl-CoA hydratase/isomerase family protein [Nocardia sp. NPDC059239]|uniref:enoyl-CoA hydratase/isomerase family protein n=1 Tax=Nocardia sp. NPDC059239 TaxID=3346785 RepID=UPI0036A6D9F9